MADNTDFQAFSNQHGDGLKITGEDYPGMNGPRSAALKSKGNITLESEEGDLTVVVDGGGTLSVENNTTPYNFLPATPNISSVFKDPNEGQVNVTSYANSVNIKSWNVGFPIASPTAPSKGIFIDEGILTLTVAVILM